MSRMGELCSEYSTLKIAETSRLEEMCGFLPLASDLSHGRCTLYLRHKDQKTYLVVAEEFPQTGYSYEAKRQIGKIIPINEEPLVKLAFETGKPQVGKKQWSILENEADIKCFPIFFSGAVQGVLLFEWTLLSATRDELAILSEVAYRIFSETVQISDSLKERISYQDGVLILNEEGKILWSNDSAGQLYKSFGVSHLLGRWYYEKLLNLKGYPRMRDSLKPLGQESRFDNKVWEIRYFPILVNKALNQSVVLIRDKTNLLEKEKELKLKEILIQEMHHRIKNNLQTIAGLLRMQARRSENQEAKEALGEGIRRISSIAVAHELLSAHLEVKVELRTLVKALVDMNQQIGTFSATQVDGVDGLAAISLSVEEVNTMSLVLNELLLNAIEHGADEKVTIGSILEGDELKIILQNKSLSPLVEWEKTEHLGLKIVKSLVEDSLKGKFSLIEQDGWIQAILAYDQGEQK